MSIMNRSVVNRLAHEKIEREFNLQQEETLKSSPRLKRVVEARLMVDTQNGGTLGNGSLGNGSLGNGAQNGGPGSGGLPGNSSNKQAMLSKVRLELKILIKKTIAEAPQSWSIT